MLEQLTHLFDRDLDRFKNEVKSFQDDKLWETTGSIENSAGILVQHTAGNLHHYIGFGMGDEPYQRDRQREFTDTSIIKVDLLKKLEEAQQAVSKTLYNMDEVTLQAECPEDFPVRFTNQELLLQLYGHLNYHLGQLNYLRRIFDQQ